MIPKIIHYCWFGRGPLPESAQKCIASWRRFFPDYEIKEWNEDNFDVNLMSYTRQAYECRKFAFVSDVARFWVLHREGGVYFDTDVEVIKPMDDILSRGAFMGVEYQNDSEIMVAPGLGLALSAGDEVARAVLDYYASLDYLDANGNPIPMTVVGHTTKVLNTFGLCNTGDIQTVRDITIYPWDYFNPLDDATGRLRLTDNTRAIHWFAKTWCDMSPMRVKISRLAHRLFGVNFSQKVKQLLHLK